MMLRWSFLFPTLHLFRVMFRVESCFYKSFNKCWISILEPKYLLCIHLLNSESNKSYLHMTIWNKILCTVSCVPRINLKRKKDSSYVLYSWRSGSHRKMVNETLWVKINSKRDFLQDFDETIIYLKTSEVMA